METHFEGGYHLTGALKANRIIYPQGIRIQIKDFVQYIENNEVHLVTVNGSWPIEIFFRQAKNNLGLNTHKKWVYIIITLNIN